MFILISLAMPEHTFFIDFMLENLLLPSLWLFNLIVPALQMKSSTYLPLISDSDTSTLNVLRVYFACDSSCCTVILLILFTYQFLESELSINQFLESDNLIFNLFKHKKTRTRRDWLFWGVGYLGLYDGFQCVNDSPPIFDQ